MSFDLKSLELFVRAATLGAIGKAGAEFGLSSTAASQRIQALEHAVGAQLLHRTTRAVSLSKEGEVFLAHAKRIIENVEDALTDVQSNRSAIKGDLRIASSASFGRMHIAPHMAEFLELYPNLSVQLHLSDSVFDIVENGFDLAIRLGALAPSSLKARKLADCPRILVAKREYLNSFGTPKSPADLEAHKCLIRGDQRSWKLRAPDGSVIDAKIDGPFVTNLAEAVTEGVLSGIGIARKCEWEISSHLASGSLVAVLTDYIVMPEWNIYAVRPPSQKTPSRVKAFTEFLGAKLKRLS
ncbi:MAG: LysR family transcriptional regulator [Pseudomonadota bacterium]